MTMIMMMMVFPNGRMVMMIIMMTRSRMMTMLEKMMMMTIFSSSPWMVADFPFHVQTSPSQKLPLFVKVIIMVMEVTVFRFFNQFG